MDERVEGHGSPRTMTGHSASRRLRVPASALAPATSAKTKSPRSRTSLSGGAAATSSSARGEGRRGAEVEVPPHRDRGYDIIPADLHPKRWCQVVRYGTHPWGTSRPARIQFPPVPKHA